MKEVRAASYVKCLALKGFGIVRLFDEAIKIALQSEKGQGGISLTHIKTCGFYIHVVVTFRFAKLSNQLFTLIVQVWPDYTWLANTIIA